jgi:hypothetical protein
MVVLPQPSTEGESSRSSQPTPWDKGYAIDTAWHRDTYIALNQTDRGIIRFERSLAGPGRLLGPSHYSPFPARDRDHMWLCTTGGVIYGRRRRRSEVGLPSLSTRRRKGAVAWQ